MKIGSIGSYRGLVWHSLKRRVPLCLRRGDRSCKRPLSRFCSVQNEAIPVRSAGECHLNIQEGACHWPASETNKSQLLQVQQGRRKFRRAQSPSEPEAPKEKEPAGLVSSTSKPPPFDHCLDLLTIPDAFR